MNLKSALTIVASLSVFLSTLPEGAKAAEQDTSSVTRAEAAMLILTRRKPPIERSPNTDQYPDVVEGEWYVPFIVAAADMGMLSGEPDTNRLHPHKAITRAEYLQMLTVALNLPTYRPHGYIDVLPIHWYAPYAGLAADHQLFFSENDPRSLHPNVPISHREAADAYYAILRKNRVLKRMYAFNKANAFTIEEPIALPITKEITTTIEEGTEKVKDIFKDLITPQPVAEDQLKNLIIAVNKERGKSGAGPLRPNRQLDTAALFHAEDMAERNYFSHFTPEGRNYVDRIQDSGYTDVDPQSCGCTVVLNINGGGDEPAFQRYSADTCRCRPSIALGENLAKGQVSVEEVMRDWMESPGHRDNILYPGFREIGLALVGNIWVQTFGKFAME